MFAIHVPTVTRRVAVPMSWARGHHVVIHLSREDPVEAGVLGLSGDRVDVLGAPAHSGNDAESESFSHRGLLCSIRLIGGTLTRPSGEISPPLPEPAVCGGLSARTRRLSRRLFLTLTIWADYSRRTVPRSAS